MAARCRRAGTAVFDCKPPASGIFDFETSGSLAQVPHLHECSIASGVSTQKQRKLPNVASSRRQHQSGNPLSVLRQLESIFYTVSSRPSNLVVDTNTFWYLNAGQRIAHSHLPSRVLIPTHRERTEPKHQTLDNPPAWVHLAIAEKTKRSTCSI